MPTVAIRATDGTPVLIDRSDFDLISQYSWYIVSNGPLSYARTKMLIDGKRKLVSMHRMIMAPAVTLVVDHIDGDGLNNSRSNLRVCTHQQNSWNTHRTWGASQYFGVSLVTTKGWMVGFKLDKKMYYLGPLDSDEFAAEVYDRLVLNYRKEFYRLNFSDRQLSPMTIQDAKILIKSIERKATGSGTSKYRGVRKEAGRYIAQLTIGSRSKTKAHYLGAYESEEAAALAFDSALRYFADRGTLRGSMLVNFPGADTEPRSPQELRRLLKLKMRELYQSKYFGVSRSGDKWSAKIRARGRQWHLGNYHTKEEAARIYDAVARYEIPSSIGLNFPGEAITPIPVDKFEVRTEPSGVTGYRGVRRKRNRFQSDIMRNRILYRLGVFDTPEEAAMAYDMKARELGETFNLNFPLERGIGA